MPDAALSGGRLLPPLRWLEECSLSGFFRGRPALDELSPTDGAGSGGVKTQGGSSWPYFQFSANSYFLLMMWIRGLIFTRLSNMSLPKGWQWDKLIKNYSGKPLWGKFLK